MSWFMDFVVFFVAVLIFKCTYFIIISAWARRKFLCSRRHSALFQKKSHPSALNDYRPVALTSRIMKVLQRHLLALTKETSSFQHLLQFAYHRGDGVEDPIMHLLQRTHCHPEKTGKTVRLTFFDFSNTFSMIQPAVRNSRRPKCMAPESLLWCGVGTIISSWMWTRQRRWLWIYKKIRNKSNPISIVGEEAEVVEEYKNLGFHRDRRLDWNRNADTVRKKVQSRLPLEEVLQSFQQDVAHLL